MKTRGDSDRSWTVDFAKKRQNAEAESQRLLSTAEPPRKRANALRAEILVEKKREKIDAAKLSDLLNMLRVAEREIREIEYKAQTIRDAIYDLKAVNPNAKSTEDTRTPEELVEFIGSKSHEVAALLAKLKAPINAAG